MKKNKLYPNDFKNFLETNFNMQLIVAGMAGLVDEGYTPHEVFDIMKLAQQNTFHALAQLREENKQ